MTSPSLDAACRLFGPGRGSAETAAALIWRDLDRCVDNLQCVVIRRPVRDISASFCALLGIDIDDLWRRRALQRAIDMIAARLDEISRASGTLTISFATLDREDVAAAIFEHCLPYRFDRDWWRRFAGQNLQVDVAAFLHNHRLNLHLISAA